MRRNGIGSLDCSPPANGASASPGTVYLVGAGPGDPELITLKGMKLLTRADVLLYDALASPELLDLAPASAERIFVGKRAGRHAMPQDEINQLLADLARRHAVVVRLKGGDPFVFGRGGEEMIFLRAAGVPVEIVPGVSSVIAAPAYAGVPVTHRRIAGNFAVVTGHRAAGPDGEQPWDALAQFDTLVILMGLANLPHIVAQLLAAGRDHDTPALAVSDATLPTQQVVSGTLANLVEQVVVADMKAPATIIVGEVAAFSQELSWFPEWWSAAPEDLQLAVDLLPIYPAGFSNTT